MTAIGMWGHNALVCTALQFLRLLVSSCFHMMSTLWCAYFLTEWWPSVIVSWFCHLISPPCILAVSTCHFSPSSPRPLDFKCLPSCSHPLYLKHRAQTLVISCRYIWTIWTRQNIKCREDKGCRIVQQYETTRSNW